MSTTLYKLPTIVVANGTGVNAWTDPSNILLVDNEFASTSDTTAELTVGTFNLAIPDDSTITNFTVKVKGYRGSFNTTLSIYAIDSSSGVSYSYPMATFQGFSGTNTEYTLPSTLFGTTWDSTQANNIQLKLMVDGELHVDAVQILATYVANVTPVPVPPSSGDTVVDEFVQGQRFSLAQSMTSSDLFAFAQSFNLPNGTPIQYADFYGEALITVDQGVPGFAENMRITNVEHDYNGTGLVRLSFTTLNNRGLGFIYPYTTVSGNRVAHTGTAEFVISNSAPFYDRFLKKNQINALVSAPIIVQDESVALVDPAHTLDFQGAGVSVANSGGDSFKKIITIAGAGVNPPVVVTTSSGTTGTSQVGSLTISHVSSGVNRGLLVQVSTEQTKTITGITYNGVALTQKTTTTDATGNIRQEQWFLLAPPVGTYDIVITMSAAAYITAGAETLTGVNQTTPTGATQTATGNSNAPSEVLVTTVNNSIVFDGLCTATTPIVYTVGAGQISNWALTSNAYTRQGASSYESAGTQPDNVTMSWAMTQSARWAKTSLEIIGITGSTGNQDAIQFEDEGVNLGTAGTVDEVDFTGAGVTATRVGNKVTVDIPGGVSGTGTKIAVDTTQASFTGDTLEHTLYTVALPANILGTNDVVKFLISFSDVVNSGGADETYRVKLGATTIGTIVSSASSVNNRITSLEGFIFADNSSSAQKTYLRYFGTQTATGGISSYGTSAVNTVGALNLVITCQAANNANVVDAESIVVESVAGSAGGSGVQSVTGLDTDNTDPANPIVQIAVDGVTITGDGTPGNPLVSVGGGGGGGSLEYATGTTTRIGTVASGVVNVAHGLATTPTKINLTAVGGVDNTGVVLTQSISTVIPGTPATATVWFAKNSGDVNSGEDSTSGIIMRNSGGTNMQNAVITADATNIIFTWTKTGTGYDDGTGSDTINIMWEAETGGGGTTSSQITIQDDFIGGAKDSIYPSGATNPIDANPPGELGWNFWSSSTPLRVGGNIDGEADHPGIFQMGNTSGTMSIYLNPSLTLVNNAVYRYIFRQVNNSNPEYIVGLTVDGTSLGGANRIVLHTQTGTTDFITSNNAGTTETTSLTPITNGQWVEMLIKVTTGATAVECWLGINGATPTLVATHSTNIPSSSVATSPVFYIVGTADEYIDVDYFSMYDPTANATVGGGSAITFTNGLATRTINTASGVQNIAHGLSVAPSLVKLNAWVKKNQGGDSMAHSLGIYDGTNTNTIYDVFDLGTSTSGSTGSDTTNGIHIDGEQVAVVTVDSTNIILTWTKSGTSTGTDINILWEAQT